MRAGRSFFIVALAAVSAVVAGTVPLPAAIGIGEPSIASAANDMTPWVLPSMPTKCTEAQKSSGNVGGCLFDGTAGLPEDRGWPTPPFPETPTATTSGDPTAWVNLQRGDSGTRVSVLQQALLAAGITVVVDGVFGSATETAVRTFQTNEGLAVTGVVDAATAAETAKTALRNFIFLSPSLAFSQWEQAWMGRPRNQAETRDTRGRPFTSRGA